MLKVVLLSYVFMLLCENEAAKILAYYPTPSISHQVVYRPLTLELAKRGHEVVVFTPDPMYPKGGGPANLKEIDLKDISYPIWKDLLEILKHKMDLSLFDHLMKYLVKLVEEQMTSTEVHNILNDKSIKFDLVIVEVFVESILGLSHHYKAPIIQFGSLAVNGAILQNFGTPIHPLIYPSPFHERVYNLTVSEKITEVFKDVVFEKLSTDYQDLHNGLAERIFGPDVPSIKELKSNVDMLFLGVHPFWDSNRPVPPNVIYLGGIHQKPQNELPEDLQNYLDSSKNGVIYVSFGTNVDPGMFFADKIKTFVNVFSKLPYDVLWKWNQDELPGRTDNIKISKWLPQTDLLRHPKTKLFITQGGLQSTDEAINSGTPLVGIPVFSDQKFNVEQSVHFGLGVKVDLDTMTEEELRDAINTVLQDDSFRQNVEKLRVIMNDQPQTPLERAVWWTEYVIRHKGAKHLRSPAANMSLTEYYELKLVGYLILGLVLILSLVIYLVYILYSFIFGNSKKLKKN
nr:uridine diphosphate-glycosyltransferases 33AP1 [Glyphodes pyloalis]